MLDFRTVTVAEESGTFFIGSQCLCIFTHNGMNHCHFQGGYFLGTDFCFAYLRGEVVVDIKVVEHLFINTVDTPDTLDYPCGIVRYIIVENSSGTVQVVTLGNGIGGNQYLVIIGLRSLLHTCVKVIANGLAHRGSSICRSIFKRRQSCFFQSCAKIVDCVGKLAKHNQFTVRLFGEFITNKTDERFKFRVELDYIFLSEPFQIDRFQQCDVGFHVIDKFVIDKLHINNKETFAWIFFKCIFYLLHAVIGAFIEIIHIWHTTFFPNGYLPSTLNPIKHITRRIYHKGKRRFESCNRTFEATYQQTAHKFSHVRLTTDKHVYIVKSRLAFYILG